MDMTEKTTSSRLVYDGRVVHLYVDGVSLPNGVASTREYIRHIGAVCVLAVNDRGEVVLERQYRYPFHKVLIEIPAGKLDTPGEDPREAALRELREETGIVPRKMELLGEYYGSPAILGERIWMFLATGFESGGARHLDEDEMLEVFTMPLDEAARAVLAGEIPDGKTQAAILRGYYRFQQQK